MKLTKTCGAIALSLISAACSTSSNMPLVFSQSQTVGLSIGAATSGEGAQLTLGYQDRNLAIIPVTVKQGDGNSTIVKSEVPKDGSATKDSMSVLGQFKLDADSAGTSVGLGKFFATGQAAKKLADGFSKKIASED